nr:MAG TPA: acyl-CoA dehydrogenase [Caudoviricetes sp.]
MTKDTEISCVLINHNRLIVGYLFLNQASRFFLHASKVGAPGS